MLQSKLINETRAGLSTPCWAPGTWLGRGVSIPFCPSPGVSSSILGCRTKQVAVQGEQLGCATGAKELLIHFFPGQLPPAEATAAAKQP